MDLLRGSLNDEGGAEDDTKDPEESATEEARNILVLDSSRCFGLVRMMLVENASSTSDKEVDRGSPIVGRSLIGVAPGCCDMP